MTSLPSLLTPQARFDVAADPEVGGGNLLRSAIAVSPDPDCAFVESVVPVAHPDGTTKTTLSLRDLEILAQSWSVWYRDRGTTRCDRVAVYIDDSFAYMIHFCALSQIGAIPVFINSYASREIAAELLRRTTPVGIYTTSRRAAGLDEALKAAGGPWVATAEEVPAPPEAVLPERDRFRHGDEDPVAILHSSGTTGPPKPTILTHKSIMAGPKFRLTDHKEAPGRKLLAAIPQSHFGCIAYMNYALLAGTPIVVAADLPGRELAQVIGRYQPTAVMSFGHGYSELGTLCDQEDQLADGILDSVNTWISLGDAVHRKHINAILGARRPGNPEPAFFDLLGSTEIGWGTLVQKWTRGTARNDRCAGSPTGVSEVRVLRRDGAETAPFEVGLLAARGPAVTPGYWNDDDGSYRGRMRGYRLTGDLAYRDEEGLFYVVDREVDAIATAAGVAYTVQLEELLINEVKDIADCAVAAGRDATGAVPVAVILPARADTDPDALLAECNQVLRKTGHPGLALLEIAATDQAYPVGVTGKVLKRRLRERYGALSQYSPEGDGSRFSVNCPPAG